MTDTDSSTPPEEVVSKRDKKKKSKKHKKKRSDSNCSVEDVQKKMKKDKKRKRASHEKTPADEASISSSSDKKKHKKKHKKSKHIPRGLKEADEKIVSSSAIEFYPQPLKSAYAEQNKKAIAEKGADAHRTAAEASGDTITLLLFYQYVEPPWDEAQFQTALKFVTQRGEHHKLTGRMRVAREGLNCTLTGPSDGIRGWCADLRKFDGGRGKINPETGKMVTEFANTEFKLTDDLPPKQRFSKLHAFEVVELVNYGLAGGRAPQIGQYGGTHLEPEEYHRKMCEEDTVVIDVRNHYEANIGRFDPPKDGAQMIDPMMRKSTEFPVWLDKPETKEMLRGKQVLMYCTGGVRCERASALLKQKMETEEDTKELGIKGVYQLQGGIDKYFKHYPEGGLWKGKNYVFDKRFAHAPPAVDAVGQTIKKLADEVDATKPEIKVKGETKSVAIPVRAAEQILSKCEACSKPWDMYRGKRRCPTCGVPSLICKECFEADKAGTTKLKEIRCDLCVGEDIRNKRDLRAREEKEMKQYEQKLKSKLDDNYEPPIQRKHAITRKPKPNPERITRLFLKNMCAKQMDEEKLLEFLQPARVTHIQWLTDRSTGKFYGSASIEVKTAEDAGSVLALDGSFVLGRRIRINYQHTSSKDVWPLPNTKIASTETLK